jgi:hypothetical protein
MAFLVMFGIVIASGVFGGAEVCVFLLESAFHGPVETWFLTDGDCVPLKREPCDSVGCLVTMLQRILNRLEQMLRILDIRRNRGDSLPYHAVVDCWRATQ